MKWNNVKSWIPAVLWLGLMIYLSRQPGTESMQASEQIAALPVSYLAQVGIAVDLETLNLSLRTVAHYLLYFIWSLLVYRAFCATVTCDVKVHWFLRPATLTILLCSLVAMLDELQKKWIPGRHCEWNEVALNCIGVLAGTLVGLLVHRLWSKHRSTDAA